MTDTRLNYLFKRYLDRTNSDEEVRELMEYIRRPENESKVKSLIDQLMNDADTDVKLPEQSAMDILQRILHSEEADAYQPAIRSINSQVWKRFLVAASILLFIAVTIYWTLNSRSREKTELVSSAGQSLPILAEKDATTLTLYDGAVIELSKLPNGVHTWGNVRLEKKNDLLIFAESGSSSNFSANGQQKNNILATSPGNQYQIELPDETHVWLNASSSLSFPSQFEGGTRKVALTGEAYFDVVRNENKPFHVKAGDMQVNVLGTQFNINSYDEESTVKTSLLEGKVELVRGKKTDILKPGQQEVYDKKANKGEIQNVDVKEVIAWKDGLFSFDGEDIKTIMGQIGRWYNVEVSFVGSEPTRKFEGKISRSAPLLDVLKVLELSGVKFSIENRKVIVYTEE